MQPTDLADKTVFIFMKRTYVVCAIHTRVHVHARTIATIVSTRRIRSCRRELFDRHTQTVCRKHDARLGKHSSALRCLLGKGRTRNAKHETSNTSNSLTMEFDRQRNRYRSPDKFDSTQLTDRRHEKRRSTVRTGEEPLPTGDIGKAGRILEHVQGPVQQDLSRKHGGGEKNRLGGKFGDDLQAQHDGGSGSSQLHASRQSHRGPRNQAIRSRHGKTATEPQAARSERADGRGGIARSAARTAAIRLARIRFSNSPGKPKELRQLLRLFDSRHYPGANFQTNRHADPSERATIDRLQHLHRQFRLFRRFSEKHAQISRESERVDGS